MGEEEIESGQRSLDTKQQDIIGVLSEEVSFLPIFAAFMLLLASILHLPILSQNVGIEISAVSLPAMLIGAVTAIIWVRRDYAEYPAGSTNEDFSIDDEEYELEILVSEYEQLCEEIRYRDRLVIKTTYFSLATLAVVANIFVSVPNPYRPLVASFGMMLSFAYAVYTITYKLTRDDLRERQENVEEHWLFNDYLSTSKTISSGSHSSATLKLTSRIVEAHVAFYLLWTGLYAVLVAGTWITQIQIILNS